MNYIHLTTLKDSVHIWWSAVATYLSVQHVCIGALWEFLHCSLKWFLSLFQLQRTSQPHRSSMFCTNKPTTTWAFRNWKKENSETRKTASILKQDPNTWKIQKNDYLLWQAHNLKFWGGNPLSHATKLDKKTTTQPKKKNYLLSHLVFPHF